LGTLRIILAITVVIAHTSKIFGFGIVGGAIAVKSFYIISGFYMTLILNEKYIGINNSYKLFISNRLLRLYPVYWTVITIAIIVSIGSYIISSGNNIGVLQPYFNYYDSMNIGSFLFLVLTNIFMLFQDIVLFLGLDIISGDLFFTSNFKQTSPALYTFLLVPQAWTIGLEITFYLIAPFIVRKETKFIYTLILFSILLRVMIYANGLNYDPWTYRFFPTELVFFLFGTIAYHRYKKIEITNIKPTHLKIIYGFILFFTFIYSFIPFYYKTYIYLFTFFICLPYVFIFSKDWKIDRYIGELSYPIYISHLVVVMIVNRLNIPLIGGQGLIVTILSIFLSILLNEFVAKKIELIRQSRIRPTANTVYN